MPAGGTMEEERRWAHGSVTAQGQLRAALRTEQDRRNHSYAGAAYSLAMHTQWTNSQEMALEPEDR